MAVCSMPGRELSFDIIDTLPHLPPTTVRLWSKYRHSWWPQKQREAKGVFDESYTLIRRRQWHPTPVLLPGNSHGQRSLLGCSPWGLEESDTTERLHFHFSLFTFLHWRRKWQPTPVFLPGESQGQGSLVGCRLWGRTESDTTEVT